MSRLSGPCGHGSGPCGATPTRPFHDGARCAAHTPWALRGEAEPEPGPGYQAQALPTPQSASALVDHRAIASGKRRAAPHEYRAARAAVDKTGSPS